MFGGQTPQLPKRPNLQRWCIWIHEWHWNWYLSGLGYLEYILKKEQLPVRFVLNQPKAFDVKAGYAVKIKSEYNHRARLQTNHLSRFISSIPEAYLSTHINLEGMLNNKTAVFSNWLVSTSYAPFLSSPNSHDLPRYMKDRVRMKPFRMESSTYLDQLAFHWPIVTDHTFDIEYDIERKRKALWF